MRDGSAPGEQLHLQLETLYKAQAAKEGDDGHGLVALPVSVILHWLHHEELEASFIEDVGLLHDVNFVTLQEHLHPGHRLQLEVVLPLQHTVEVEEMIFFIGRVLLMA
jgi:hypothetical protein